MADCTPTQIHHLFVYAVIATFALLALCALIAAGWRYFRLGRWVSNHCDGEVRAVRAAMLGHDLITECCEDDATAYAELREIRAKNVEDERRLREGMVKAFNNGGEK